MISINENNKKMCCGCTACVNVCPANAIKMENDFEGFLYPIVDKEKCINCGLCDKTCPYKNKIEVNSFLKSFVIQNKDQETLNNSTSGGFFTPISKYVIQNNGYVCGAIVKDDLSVEHIIYDKQNLDEIYKFRGSKYVQSQLNNAFKIIKKKLDDGKLVCFSGSPCQVVGLKKYLKKEYANLITVDFVCRGVPSALFLKKYIDYQERKYNSKIRSLYFRSKTYGYHSGTLTLKFENGKKYTGSNRVDLYSKCFHKDVCSRPSCYNCIAKGIERISDFTVFDSWHPEKLVDKLKDNDKGYSNLFIHTKKGYDLFINILSRDFNYYEIDANKASSFTGKMMTESINKDIKRDDFYKKINEEDFEKAVYNFINVSLLDRIFEISKKLLYRLGFLKFLKKLKVRR